MPPAVERDDAAPEVQLILVDSRNHTGSGDLLSALMTTSASITCCRNLTEAEMSLQNNAQNILLIPVDNTVYNTFTRLQTRDLLTGAGNRQHFYRTLQEELGDLQADDALALMMLDIDNFSAFNSQYGHDTGDRLVKLLCKRLERCDNMSHLSRIGNDEFTLIIKASVDQIRNATRQAIERIVELLLPAYRIDDYEVHLHCSIGIAVSPEQGLEFESLIHCANTARLRAKQLRGHSYAFYDPLRDLNDNSRGISLEPELWYALQRQQFRLFYQPRICLNTHRIIGAEALIRWEHPVRGMISPDEFIPISEKSGLIVPIGYWVIEQVGQDMKILKQAGLPEHIGVNLSFRQFQDGYLASTIERLILQHQIDTSMLEFELTETALFRDESHVVSCMRSLGKLGVEFSLDDFGTGYSSFSMLQKLPISTLKIDKSFVKGIGQSSSDEEIVRTIISLARNLKKKIIAEGVETLEQLDFLKAHHCQMAQGYYFSRPVPLAQFLQLLDSSTEPASP
ncbi:putative bifunctional diguanylate cyclase/phosphodiesterase [Nitrincola iocasae]|uniref:cyclic-guanylate-specific phosphodiesterase n=1 Tax=Nitrincola iocasae TaxID=2614693 RepID=A0A5J6LHY8_9GAMM|nr:bifunctional diguanylate cyclase/phosphodiesterase [Nitrincola iocasae]QEW08165.1 bifunctional diguanylate cyclase/phosphodiesterase [Nitrincola iocasae]